ncbi:TetR family transcriptional regulator [Fictibacillus sp. KU28468]|uniref:TetR family transcriptional regulator n=1 Tax=Fictibacillus sp. KU28468 TaxID=2991053 RepID=UPI00223D40D8|nr:TetR family transcriptional regulator [Fictibacillus sp. KU28468]UZJ80213.1 TetR/AcrR family transcriptional regulator [Fictibacillus sp. KU28468]
MSPKVPHEHKEQRQREILMASKKVFAQKGYEAASIKDIMDATSISRGGIYAYFSNKEHIFLSLLEQMMEDNRKELDELLQKNNGSVWKTLLTLLDDYRRAEYEDTENLFSAAIVEYGITHWRKPENRDYIEKRYEGAASIFSVLIQKGVDAGEFNPIAPVDDISRFMISFLDGLAISAISLTHDLMRTGKQMDLFESTLKMMLNVQKPDLSQR